MDGEVIEDSEVTVDGKVTAQIEVTPDRQAAVDGEDITEEVFNERGGARHCGRTDESRRRHNNKDGAVTGEVTAEEGITLTSTVMRRSPPFVIPLGGPHASGP